MNLPKNNDGLIELKDEQLSISVDSSKNSCETLTKIGLGNKVVTLSYKSWNFGPICARYSSNGCRVLSSLVLRFSKLRRKAIIFVPKLMSNLSKNFCLLRGTRKQEKYGQRLSFELEGQHNDN